MLIETTPNYLPYDVMVRTQKIKHGEKQKKAAQAQPLVCDT
jgi:hypothetical protein